jgi:hypothetical protein
MVEPYCLNLSFNRPEMSFLKVVVISSVGLISIALNPNYALEKKVLN